ncbi:putative beta-phosphoglucomutase [Nitrospira sp. KM1]|uniref:HAD family hydrolase n=1 Tax=Nitrospira sp. KM1 TaxID=1936990 RepID=UPI0013A76790|nr:HAD family phosphatase [Nitrospira sp. KM1]BCA57007.1 putative beta-phosphoglucomutase [Nitrospira sp. KM1]
MPQLKAIIFDFDGIIANTEPLHYAALRNTLREIGISLSETEYYREYLGFDDRGCFIAALTTNDRPIIPTLMAQLMDRKAKVYMGLVKQPNVLFPGVVEFVKQAGRAYPLAIASGALRHEIEYILEGAGLRKEFTHITSAEDVARGKPDPQPFLHALRSLQRLRDPHLTAESCLVIEDSLPGVESGKAASMKVLAVTNTHSVQDLHRADAVTHTLAAANLDELRIRLWPSS